MNATCPSRHTNPFATCWTRPGAVEFQFPAGQSADRLVAQLAAANWWGEIIGPHGSGKSTLLESLKPDLTAAGRGVSSITLHDAQRRLPKNWLRHALASSRPLVIVDGYELLSRISRLRLRWRCRRARAGLVVTAHAPTGLPLLFQSQADLTLAAHLVSTLTRQIPSPITDDDVAASHACHGSNLRDLFFALYCRHETLSRGARTVAPRSA